MAGSQASIKVLRILDFVVYKDNLKSVFLNGSDIAIPAIRNYMGIFLHKTEQNEKVLSKSGCSYVKGVLSKISGFDVFYPDVERSYIQFLAKPDFSLGLEVPGAVTTEYPEELEGAEQVALASGLTNQILRQVNSRLHTIPVKSKLKGFQLDLFFKKAGEARGVFLVTRDRGIVRIVFKKDEVHNFFRVGLEPMYPTYEPSGVK